ncbi:MAG TPA: ABC transporter substrate-binding protein [Solirubrobacterales bacterium]|jgi:polar amino acid transport system substrate-binding protein|nr:ABC transporter substrate-binding protein [Solirubrobacterales bacterium]HMU27300.1 ABC transporter substrate-binding protein [Solirubrobacterales bacterium]HMX71317.1 ABC transporter substrate-binding protein [Solirubrobacterales bacterium]HMY26001.1 ABC transporter substrate-binding protein [Solirubrobacterales bacterium]HNA24705.1 ABC transporter substrate-binding protein [Solirubrobacterales bacterium]
MKKSRLIALLSALMILAAMVVVVGCGSSDDDSSSSDNGSTAASGDFSSELINEGTLTVGTDTPYPPFEFGDAPDYNGFDVNLVDEIANRLGLETKWVDTSFDTIFTDVAQGKFDMVASASTITPDRQKTVNFSDPYYSAQQALLVPEGSDISSVEDLDGKTVGAQNGTTGKDFAENETNASRVQGYPNGPAAIEAVKNGQVEATIIDQPVAQDAIDKGQTGFEVATTIPTGELYGFAFAKDTPELLAAVNKTLAEMKDDGSLDKIYQKYFSINAPEEVVNGTTTNP